MDIIYTKKCRTCLEVKEEKHFYQKRWITSTGKLSYCCGLDCKACHNNKVKEWATKNKETRKKIARTWANKNKSNAKKIHLKRKFNLNIDDYNNLVESQGNVCRICLVSFEKDGVRKCVDHCHKSGKIRGILCHKCNAGLGMFNDKIICFKNAIAYLEEYETNNQSTLHSE